MLRSEYVTLLQEWQPIIGAATNHMTYANNHLPVIENTPLSISELKDHLEIRIGHFNVSKCWNEVVAFINDPATITTEALADWSYRLLNHFYYPVNSEVIGSYLATGNVNEMTAHGAGAAGLAVLTFENVRDAIVDLRAQNWPVEDE